MLKAKTRCLICTSIAAANIVAAAPAARAQDTEQLAENPEEEGTIIVTARRRDESLADAPIALSVVGSEQIEKLNLTTLEDVTNRTPGVQFTSQSTIVPGRVATSIRFRGMDSNSSTPSQQVGTLFLDGIYVSTGVSSVDLGSLERIEVIKGPQSATFGRSTFGGAINYVTKTPSFTPRGRVSASLAEYGTYDFSLSHEGPLTDSVAYRVSVRGFGTDGQYRSAADGGELGKEKTTQIGLTLYAEPNDNVRIKLNGYYGEDRDGQNSGTFIGTALSNRGDGPALANCNALDPSRVGQATDYFCGNVNDIVDAAGFSWDELVNANTVVTPALRDILAADNLAGLGRVQGVPSRTSLGLSRDSLRLGGSLEWDLSGSGILDNSTISVLTGFNEVGYNLVQDMDQIAIANWLLVEEKYDRDFSAEMRWSSDPNRRLRASLGVSYLDILHERGGGGGAFIYDYLGELGVPTPFGTPSADNPLVIYFNGPAQETGETLGIFGYLGFDITDTFTLDFEGRYQSDKVGQDDGTNGFDDTFNNFLPRVTLSFDPTPDTTLWATWSKGNLPGFFNSAIPGLDESELADVRAAVGDVGIFNDEEKLTNYEIGWRQSVGNALNFSLVGYYMEWTNQKTRAGIPVTDNNGTPSILTLQISAGDSELWGVEFETDWRAGSNLSGTFALNYAGAKYTDFTCSFSPFVVGNVSGRAPCTGNRPAKFPEWSGSASVAWDAALNADWDYFIIGDANYSGKAFNEEANFSWIGDTTIANLRAGVQSENLKLEAFVTNLFDNDDLVSASRVSDFSTSNIFGFSNNMGLVVTPPRKRTIGMRAVFDF